MSTAPIPFFLAGYPATTDSIRVRSHAERAEAIAKRREQLRASLADEAEAHRSRPKIPRAPKPTGAQMQEQLERIVRTIAAHAGVTEETVRAPGAGLRHGNMPRQIALWVAAETLGVGADVAAHFGIKPDGLKYARRTNAARLNKDVPLFLRWLPVIAQLGAVAPDAMAVPTTSKRAVKATAAAKDSALREMHAAAASAEGWVGSVRGVDGRSPTISAFQDERTGKVLAYRIEDAGATHRDAIAPPSGGTTLQLLAQRVEESPEFAAELLNLALETVDSFAVALSHAARILQTLRVPSDMAATVRPGAASSS